MNEHSGGLKFERWTLGLAALGVISLTSAARAQSRPDISSVLYQSCGCCGTLEVTQKPRTRDGWVRWGSVAKNTIHRCTIEGIKANFDSHDVDAIRVHFDERHPKLAERRDLRRFGKPRPRDPRQRDFIDDVDRRALEKSMADRQKPTSSIECLANRHPNYD